MLVLKCRSASRKGRPSGRSPGPLQGLKLAPESSHFERRVYYRLHPRPYERPVPATGARVHDARGGVVSPGVSCGLRWAGASRPAPLSPPPQAAGASAPPGAVAAGSGAGPSGSAPGAKRASCQVPLGLQRLGGFPSVSQRPPYWAWGCPRRGEFTEKEARAAGSGSTRVLAGPRLSVSRWEGDPGQGLLRDADVTSRKAARAHRGGKALSDCAGAY